MDMTDIRPTDYVAAGYFLSCYAGIHDCTGGQLRRITMAHDHSQRRFFPESWTLSWCHETRERRIKDAAVFGIAQEGLEEVMAWADKNFGSVFGAWNVFFTQTDARAAARLFLQNATGLELWGVGLHHTLLPTFREMAALPPPQPGCSPEGASAIEIATCVHSAPLADGGAVLGHEILVADVGCSFNSPESLHMDEQEVLREAGVAPNPHGLIDSLDDAITCCKLFEPDGTDEQERSAGWLPWLIVRYQL
jgi:hypothetical protein